VGNRNLQTTKIHNYDLRYEFYPSKGEMITIGGFYKDFTNPIEMTFDVGSQDPRNVNFQNPPSAKSYGLELEAKKSLAGMTGSAILDRMNVMLNASLIKSEVINPNAPNGQEKNRPMQGQAPYVVNAAIFYNDEAKGWQINTLYNIVGKSIVFVGNENFRSVYQMSRGVLDLTFSKQLGERVRLRGGISDVLNRPIQFMQDGNNNAKIERKSDLTTQKYKPGQVFSIGFSFKL
jgi:outer membrane receptor protein involved in Fe transport